MYAIASKSEGFGMLFSSSYFDNAALVIGCPFAVTRSAKTSNVSPLASLACFIRAPIILLSPLTILAFYFDMSTLTRSSFLCVLSTKTGFYEEYWTNSPSRGTRYWQIATHASRLIGDLASHRPEQASSPGCMESRSPN
jgi:hypothetical protein